MRGRLVRALLVAAFVLAPVATAPGQQARPARLELRTDAFFAHRPAVQLGVGIAIPTTTYMRVAGIVAAGAASTTDGTQPSARGELLARFVLDPLGERRWGVYGAAGVAAFWDNERKWRGRLVLGAGVEGRARGAWSPAFELGVGEGFRVAVVLRRVTSRRR